MTAADASGIPAFASAVNGKRPLGLLAGALADVSNAKFESALGAFLVGEGIVEQAVLERAANAGRKTGERLDRALTKLGLVSESDLAVALSKYLAIPLAALSDVPSAPILAEVVGPDFSHRNRILPLGIYGDTLIVGVVDPLDIDPVRALAFLTNLTVHVRIFTPADFDKAFEALYAAQLNNARSAISDGTEAGELDVQRLRDMASEAPIIRLVNQIIINAVDARASDIHIEPNANEVLVRYRIDGLLRTVQTLAQSLRPAMTSRVKIMSKLDIAERRMPQDGRIKIAVHGIDIDFRVSTIPTIFGESVVMRILDRSRVELDFGKLGFSHDHVAAFHRLMNEPNGIILVTGPTGSGKTTTLYAALKVLNSSERKIFTVEDPIEYQLNGINQVQVHGAIGLDFPHALRSILRQDPDIIMIGEIRDLETARIAIQSSLTGHLVLATLHTNNAASAITRLIDMGVEHYLLASTVKGIIAQRLVRNLCPRCSRRHDGADHWIEEFAQNVPGISALGAPDVRVAQGCPDCGNIGYSGRSTIAEILLVDEHIHRLILSKASDGDIDATARRRGMVNMYDMGVTKVWRGETTVEEVLRATRAG